MLIRPWPAASRSTLAACSRSLSDTRMRLRAAARLASGETEPLTVPAVTPPWCQGPAALWQDRGMSDQQAPTAPDVATLVIGILGGTGDEGRGLACRFAR